MDAQDIRQLVLEVVAAAIGGQGELFEQMGMKAIFSCKPNPSYITGGWDEDLMRKDTMRLMQEGKGTAFEIILKDTHTIQDPRDFRKWTDLCRECAAKVFG